MTFLMVLNESFAQIRSQLLLLDPIPSINKVFSLISQKERQRNISSQIGSRGVDTVNNMAFLVKNNGNKKHVLFSLPAIEIRRKNAHSAHTATSMVTPLINVKRLDGYPLCYKQKQKSQSVIVNQVSKSSHVSDKSDHTTGNVGQFLENLNMNQYQQLMNYYLII